MKKALAIILTTGLTFSLAMPTAWAAEDNTTAAEDTATADEAVTVEGIEHTFNITEATAVQKYVVKISTFTEYEQRFYDVNNDGVVNISDSTLIQKFIVRIKETPKFYETSGYTIIEYPAEYKEVYHEAVTEEVPTYVCDERYICTACGEDITDLFYRMDCAVEDGLIVPGDGNYEKLTQIDGHFYYFSTEGFEDIYGLIIPADDSYHDVADRQKIEDADCGWTTVPHWVYYGTNTYVSEEDYKNDVENYFAKDLRLVWENYKKPTTLDITQCEVIYKTTTEQEAYTEKVLVKEAYTEQIPIEAGWH